ncbi:MAG: aminoacyl-tRNA hydrolase [Deltaproteobacteria bacterium]|nr:aminoacyl-tRNA hydrolase [Deltaproteobacteria bacterium]
MVLIAGLGNPGQKYAHTRHNVGFRVIEQWARSLGFALRGRRFHSRSCQTALGGKGAILLCPLTFMNLSGLALKACVEYYRIDTRDILIVHDDIDLPVGRIRVARNRGGGGHKGIQSVIDHLGTRQFARVRIGVGRPRYLEQVEEFVLTPFYRDEDEVIDRVVQVATEACELFVSEGVEKAMSHVNWQNLGQKEEDDRCRG